MLIMREDVHDFEPGFAASYIPYQKVSAHPVHFTQVSQKLNVRTSAYLFLSPRSCFGIITACSTSGSIRHLG